MSIGNALPSPVFEGSEKRLELHFCLGDTSPRRGLRNLTRQELDRLLELAACEIVSHTSSFAFDAYVLSESSLFVFRTKWILKTCGTTKLLSCLADVLAAAQSIGMSVEYASYSRASFLFPHLQPEEYHSFDREVQRLMATLPKALVDASSAHVLGDRLGGSLQWHVYTAGTPHGTGARLEVAMTGLNEACAAQFVRDKDFVSAQRVTAESGIGALVPGAVIDDYVFEPCGYSMNGLAASGLMTIHVTPEPAFSYASCEIVDVPAVTESPAALTSATLGAFQPRTLAVTLTTWGTGALKHALDTWARELPEYSCRDITRLALSGGVVVCMATLSLDDCKDMAMRGSVVYGRLNGSQYSMASMYSSTCGMDESLDDAAQGSGAETVRAPLECSDCRDNHEIVSELCTAEWPGDGTDDQAAYTKLVCGQQQLLDTCILIDLGAVNASCLRWRRIHAATPGVPVSCCRDSPTLSLLSFHGAHFDVASAADVAALEAASIPASRSVMTAAVKRPRDICAAATFGVRRFAVASPSEVERVAQHAPGAEVLVHCNCDMGVVEVADAACAAGLSVAGLCLAGAVKGAGALYAALSGSYSIREVHVLGGMPCAHVAEAQSAFAGVSIVLHGAELPGAAVSMVTPVLAAHGAEVLVADIPQYGCELNSPVALRPREPRAFVGQVLSEQMVGCEGGASAVAMLADVRVGDWLLWTGLPVASVHGLPRGRLHVCKDGGACGAQ